jgi:phosphoglycerol transferase MdoB-like AlkP superfamily enzyme
VSTDNHAPNGNASPKYPRDIENIPEFAKVIKCTNSFISDFIKKLKKSGVLKNTVLVLLGDHLFMNNRAQESLFPPLSERFVYFNYKAPNNDCLIKRSVLTGFDIAPTILDLTLGMKVKQYGLGFNSCVDHGDNFEEAFRFITTKDLATHSKLYRTIK